MSVHTSEAAAELAAVLAKLTPAEREQVFLSLPLSMQHALIADGARGSFAEFVRQAWQYVPQVEPLSWNWHMDAICIHYEAVARGLIPKLVVNCPPGHAKSVLLAVLWPAWIWTWWPSCQMLFASYSDKFVQRDSVRCRDVIESDWYRETFMLPGGWLLKADQNTKTNFVNTKGGVRQATSVAGAGAGLRANIVGIDDPINISDARSKAARTAANDFIGKTLSQRFIDARQPKVALVMQRLDQDDPTAFVLGGGDWQHVRLPSEFEKANPSVTFVLVDGKLQEFWRDPRTVEGELLFPERFPRDVLEAAKRPNALGAEGYAGQHLQRPRPAGGGMFKIADWRFYRRRSDEPDHRALRPRDCWDGEAILLPELDRVLISVDATFTKTTSGSFVAIHVWGVSKAARFLLERVKERMDFAETVKILLGVIARWPDAREKVIEAKANGSAIMSTLINTHGISGVIAENPGKENKEQRAAAMLPYHRAGNLYLPDGAPWLDNYIEEHAVFPNGKYNDDVDAQSQALKHLERVPSVAENWAQVAENMEADDSW